MAEHGGITKNFVVRGPDWNSDSKDGGEGYYGEVISENNNGTVVVQWMSGLTSDHGSGGENGFRELALLHVEGHGIPWHQLSTPLRTYI